MSIASKLSLALLAIIALAGCQTTPKSATINNPDELHHSIGEGLGLSLATAETSRETGHYHYEWSIWTSDQGDLELQIHYVYLFDNYVFAGKAESLHELIRTAFEDRVVSIEAAENETILPQINTTLFNRFDLDNASCLYFRRYLSFDVSPDLIGNDPFETYLGDGYVRGHLCNYARADLSWQEVKHLLRGIETQAVAN